VYGCEFLSSKEINEIILKIPYITKLNMQMVYQNALEIVFEKYIKLVYFIMLYV